MKSTFPMFVLSMGVCGYAAVSGQTSKPNTPSADFDRDVMPIISQHCYKCHGPDAAKAAAGLRLDSFDIATKQKALVPGHPELSHVIGRVSEKNPDLRMPPSDSGVKPLTPYQIEVLKAWIKAGARYEKHWSYVPPTMPAMPSVSSPNWCKNPIDRFVLAKLDAAGLKPEPEADRNTLALRAAQTLTGLPPSSSDLEAFRKDLKPGAYERFVDRLLAEPTYGENEARYWLDAVRYGDTHGLQLDNERGVYPYRDWVVRAYNHDLPFNKFVEWQLAGDLLPKPTTEQLIATGYIRMNLTSNEGGAIEEEFLARNTFDRVDTAGTVFLGLTVQCAKCHDHKYDPIKQKDYYGLYAFFDNTADKPLDGNELLPPPVVRAANPMQEAKLTALAQTMTQILEGVSPSEAASYFDGHHAQLPSSRNWQVSRIYPAESFDQAFDRSEPSEPGQLGDNSWKPISFAVGKDQPNLIRRDNSSLYLRGTVNLVAARNLSFGVSSDDGIRVWLNGKLIHSHKISRGVNEGIDRVTGSFKAGDNELVVKLINGGGPDGLNIRLSDVSDQRIDDAMREYRKSPSSAPAIKELRTAYLELGPKTANAEAFGKAFKDTVQVEAAIPMSLIAQEMPTPRPTFILKRGQYDQKGDMVNRHLPAMLGELPKGASVNRLGFAQWLTSPKNPLLSRVFVNRVWQQHFGVGIVKTAEDFGSQGEWPLNQPLLDYLALSLQNGGWSVKKLNRMIVTSAAFRQASRISPIKLAKDPENRLCSRGPRFRLDAEIIRDKALTSGGLLVEEQGGHGFKPYQPEGIWEGASDPASGTHTYMRDHDKSIYRRSMYLFWKRTAPPPVMLTFDAPLRDTCTVRRATTNTPLQALTTENETEFLESSREMAARILSVKGDDDKRLRVAYNIAMSRPPRPIELTVLKKALSTFRKRYSADHGAANRLLKVGDPVPTKSFPASEQASWMLICSTLMNTDEFLTLH